MKALKVVGLFFLVLSLLYVLGDMMRDKNRQAHEVGLQQCRARWKACLIKAKNDSQVNLCSADLDLCINNLP